MKKIYLLLALIILSFFTVFTACNTQVSRSIQSSIAGVANVKRVKVINNQSVRSGLTANSPVLRQVTRDTPLEVVNQVANNYAVRLPNGDIGFVPTSQCQTLAAENTIYSNTTLQGVWPFGNTQQGSTITNTNPNVTPGTNAGTTTGNNTGTTGSTGTTGTTANNQAPTAGLSQDEQSMVNLVNSARAQNGLKALIADTQVANVARIKAQDMIAKNYFDHNSPTYGSPFDMLRKFGINFTTAGENIAGNQTVAAAQEAFMNSPGHRANILNANYTHIGIGIRSGGPYGMMFSQMFISK